MSWNEENIVGWAGAAPKEPTGNPKMRDDQQAGYEQRLDRCGNFKEVFQIVRESVRKSLHLERRGLMLFLADMPYRVGAYHQVGTNNIVMNRALLNHVLETAEATREANAFIYSILLHEYLHSLGYLDEGGTRDLTYRVTKETFGEGHLATKMAASNPWQFIKPLPYGTPTAESPPSVVRDFEPPPFGYIS